MTATKTSHHAQARHSGRSSGAPRDYESLRAYFASVTARAQALGVERKTIRTWDEGLATRIRRVSQERVSTLLVALRDVEQLIGDQAQAGRWMLTEQPALRGASPTQILVRLGSGGLEVVRQLANGANPVQDEDVPDRDTFWRVVEAKLDRVALEAVHAARERARDFDGRLSL